MRKTTAAIGLAITLATGPVAAVETFTLAYDGTAVVPVDCFVQPLACGLFKVPWHPIVTVQLTSAADGVYSFQAYPPDNPANTLTFLSLVSPGPAPIGSVDSLDLSTQDSGLLGGLTATVQGGRLTSLDGLIVGDFQARWRFAGIEVDFDQPLIGKSGPYSGHAAMVPEPDVYALMAAGLAAAAWARRRAVRRQFRDRSVRVG